MKLVPLNAVNPSTYNPRQARPERLDMIELSLRKLGFLLPIYADPNGEILSGHQRHHVATRMGLKEVPVAVVPEMSLDDRKAVNIAFNRGTNDLAAKDTPEAITAQLAAKRVHDLAAALPDKDVGSMYPCLRTEQVAVDALTKANSGRWVTYARNAARLLASKGIHMPVVATRDLKVVNGIGRVQFAAESGIAKLPVVFITDAEAQFSDAMLNLLSMDFDIHTRYRDLLRYNSFRRVRRARAELGLGFIFVAAPRTTAKSWDVTKPANREKWIRTHGDSVVDFGAGHLTETEILRSIGVYVSPFEPFRCGAGDQIDKAESLRVCRAFLQDVASGRKYTSIFISSVLNSVPFAEDRQQIAAITHALAGARTRLYAVASSIDHANYSQVRGTDNQNERRASECVFRLDYEPGITIGDFSAKPKVQKYHSEREFYDLFKPFWGKVNIKTGMNNVEAVCAEPQPVDPEKLRRAIEFEFDLPYPDGSRMGLVTEAKAAFGKRLQHSL